MSPTFVFLLEVYPTLIFF